MGFYFFAEYTNIQKIAKQWYCMILYINKYEMNQWFINLKNTKNLITYLIIYLQLFI